MWVKVRSFRAGGIFSRFSSSSAQELSAANVAFPLDVGPMVNRCRP
jgi:hypothetical protein